MNEHIALIQSLGLDVYLPDVPRAMWCYFTDGTRIGYAQWGGYDCSTSTVHYPSQQCGTGFKIGEGITVQSIRDSFATAPNWASSADRAAVRKYADFETFRSGYWCKLTKLESQA